MKFSIAALVALGASTAKAALDVDLTNADSIKKAASTVAYNLLTYYKGNESGMTPGVLPGPPPAGPYYWWEGGALWGTLVDYYRYTGDDTYVNLTRDCIIFQAAAPTWAFMHPNWTASLGNDDQGFWAMSAMLAAEANFPNPPSGDPGWLALVQAVFNKYIERWDTQSCAGGLRWQIYLTNNGYDYKNSIANGIFFNIAARLWRYTGNTTYYDWADKVYNWTAGVGYLDKDYNVYDGGHVQDNCTDINRAQFSYVAASYIQGAGFMYNHTNGSALWEDRLTGLLNRTFTYFFPDGIMVESSCELQDNIQCTTDMLSFKGYFHRWLAQTAQLAPHFYSTIMDKLKTSAEAAANTCNPDGTCGFRWNRGTYDGNTGAGQQMNALGALMSMLAPLTDVEPAVTNTTGGTSQGDPNAGSSASDSPATVIATTSDKAGAGILTALVLIGMLSMLAFMSTEWFEGANTITLGEKGKGLSGRLAP